MTSDMIVDESHEARWAAMKARDKSYDGTFICAVLTTRIYCRVGCPARLPRPENVRFFATAKDAIRAGFRACKRCKPDADHSNAAHTAAIAKACKAMEDAEAGVSFDEVAAGVGMSRFHFHRVFREIMGVTPGGYLRAVRERRVVNELARGGSVTEAIYGAGYSSSSRFYEGIAPKLGLKPSSFAKGGKGETIRFAVGQCSLGSIIVAATDKGVCCIQFGDDPQRLVLTLQDRFPNAEIIGADTAFEQTVAKVVGLVEDPGRGINLPLDVRGTAFQHRVWAALLDIPAGKTMTYGKVAAAIGSPGAVRAVASACAGNKLAVAIPCHRVIRTDGSLSGYRWGVERKAALLAKEAEASA